MESAIKVENLSKVFYNKKAPEDNREIWALNNVSFEVKKGEIFGLLGPNGAGKTTAIRCMSGILKLTSGKIHILGNQLNQLTAHKSRNHLGFLTENHGSYENLSVYDNLSFFGDFYKINNLGERIEEVLKKIELYDRKDMKAGKLSKGQRQRLAIARAILHEPEITFFDEPTSGLDPIAAVNVRELILSLKEKNRTIFINSHNLEEVQKICDRVAILDLGKIKRIGTPDELSRELWDTQEMVCTLKNPVSTQIEEKLEKLDYIQKFSIENNKIYVFSSEIDDTTPRVIKELVMLDAEILEVGRTVHSLEDIYLKLMKEETKLTTEGE